MAQLSTISVANQDEAERCVSKGEEYLRKLQIERAISFWERAIRLSPGSNAAAKANSLIEAARKELSSGRAPRVVETQSATASSAPRRAGEAESQQESGSVPPSDSRGSRSLGGRVWDALDQVYRRLLDLVGSFGILPPYRAAILCVYVTIFVLLAYRYVFGWTGFFQGNLFAPHDHPSSRSSHHTHPRPPAGHGVSNGWGDWFEGIFSVSTVLHGLSLLSLFGFFPNFFFVSAGGPFTFLTAMLGSLFFQRAFRRPHPVR